MVLFFFFKITKKRRGVKLNPSPRFFEMLDVCNMFVYESQIHIIINIFPVMFG